MAYYLQMDGVDDYLKTPSMTFNQIVLDMKSRAGLSRIYLDARNGQATGYFQKTSGGQENWGASISSVKLNGVSKSNATSWMPVDTRCTVEVNFSTAAADDVNIFSGSNNASVVAGDLYDVKLYNGATLVAHYDMTLGNVQDQSGNGNHATLTGGTWVNDAAGTDATVTGIAATATNSAVAPSVSGAASITSTAAVSSMSAIAPSVSADANVTAIAATVTASANAPFIGQVTQIVAVPATASVQAITPSVSTVRQVTVNSIAASSTAAMRIASIIVVLPVYPKIILSAERITQIPLSAERVVMIQLQAGGGRMTKENQNFDMYAGDGFDLLFPLPSKKDDLSTASITWTLKDRLGGTVLLTKTVGSGITVDGSSFTVRLDGSDTSPLKGRYFYVGEITKDGLKSTSVTGHIKIETT